MGSRTWIKIYCDPWIQGTLREETPDVRGVWADLLALAGSGQYGDTGEIKLANGIGYTDRQIAEILHITKPLWRRARQRFLETDRIKVSPRGAILIVNWGKYQSEYDRQKPYRKEKPGISIPEPKSPLTNPLEKEREIESEKLHPPVTPKSYKRKLENSAIDYEGVTNVALSNPIALRYASGISPIIGEKATISLKKGNEKTSVLSTKHGHKLPVKDQIIDYLTVHKKAGLRVISQDIGEGYGYVYLILHQGEGKQFHHYKEERLWGLSIPSNEAGLVAEGTRVKTPLETKPLIKPDKEGGIVL